MKKLFFISALLILTFATFSCRDKKKEVVVKETTVVKEEGKGALERAAEKVDKEVNEEIDEQIEKIGDDN